MRVISKIFLAIACLFSLPLCAEVLLGTVDEKNPGVIRTDNVHPTQSYSPTNVNAWLKIDIDKETDTVHFVRDNNNPFVVTKTYLLKNADPYEIRKYLNIAIQANKVDKNPTVVDCIKYNDGTGLILVGAEDYRFTSNQNGMSIDEIVASLDLPNLQCYTGQRTYMYFPLYWDSRSLSEIVKRVGANITSTNTNELRFGSDKIGYDEELNCLFMYIPQYSRKNIEDMLKLYDTPETDIRVNYKLYEIYAENDAKIGADFEAWKNNAGIDFFGVGGQFRNGWSSTWQGGAMSSNSGYGNTRYYNFNPKWNTRYFDFLAAKGYAKIVTSGRLSIMQEQTGTVTQKTNIFNPVLEKIPDQALVTYMILKPYARTNASGVIETKDIKKDDYRIYQATDSSGAPITVVSQEDGAVLSVSRITYGSFVSYDLNVMSGNAHFLKNGTNIGTSTKAYNVIVQKASLDGYELPTGESAGTYTINWIDQTDYSTSLNIKNYHGYKEWTSTYPDGYGFTMTITPNACDAATTMDLVMSNSSLIGWKSDGSPRISQATEVKTKIMLFHGNNTFVIGGLEKKSVVSSVSGLPYLKDLPFIGWIFSTESESTKKSQLVLVMDCTLDDPDSKLSTGELGDIMKINQDLNNAGEKNSWGKDQYYLGVKPDKSSNPKSETNKKT